MMLISRIRNAYKRNKKEWVKYVNYVRDLFNRIFKNDP